ncbi:MAG: dephospho-CoA kinase, partial [Candidatus Omnitrophica bacterium]|nr:dephospho-CoA kinase [Candidatus Omnitrophota bacterium]
MCKRTLWFKILALIIAVSVVTNDIGYSLQVQTASAPITPGPWTYREQLDREFQLIRHLIDKDHSISYPDINAAVDSCYITSRSGTDRRLLDVTANPVIDSEGVTLQLQVLAGEKKGSRYSLRWQFGLEQLTDHFGDSPAATGNGAQPAHTLTKALGGKSQSGPIHEKQKDGQTEAKAPSDKSGSKSLIAVTGLTATYFVVEFVYSFITGSLCLRADSFHMFMDVASLLLALGAIYLTKKLKLSLRYEGNSILEIGAAFMNGATIFFTSFYIIVEGIERAMHSVTIEGNTLAVVAIGGLLINVVSACLLLRTSKESINMRGAFLHVIGDAAVSVVVIGSGFLIGLGFPSWIDTVASIVISLWLAWYAKGVTFDAIAMFRGGLAPSWYTINYLKREWEELCAAIGIPKEQAGEIFADIRKQYSQKNRHFHDLTHIAIMLKELENVQHLASDLNALKCAIWFHDYVLDPQRTDNREESVRKVEELGAKHKLEAQFIDMARHLIIATKDDSPDENDMDAVILSDLNIAFLGGAQEQQIETFFDSPFFSKIVNLGTLHRSEQKILQEHAGPNAQIFVRKRLAKLHSLLKSDHIYRLDYFRQKYEDRARAHIRHLIAQYEKENIVAQNIIYPQYAGNREQSAFNLIGNEKYFCPIFIEDMNPVAVDDFEEILSKIHGLRGDVVVVIMQKDKTPRKSGILEKNVTRFARQFARIKGVSVIGLRDCDILTDLLVMLRADVIVRPLSEVNTDSILSINITDTGAKELYEKFGIDTFYVKVNGGQYANGSGKGSFAGGKKANTAFYRGAFDPVTNIDIELVERAAQVYNEVVVLVESTSSSDRMFSLKARIHMFEDAVNMLGLKNVAIVDSSKVPQNQIDKGITIAHIYEYRKAASTGVRDRADIYFPLYSGIADSSRNVRLKYMIGEDVYAAVPPNVYWFMMLKRLDRKNTNIIGLVGGSGAGKSTITKALRKKEDIACITLDEVSDHVHRLPEVKQKIVATFSNEILGRDGNVDKNALRRIAFKTKKSKMVFMMIVYPAIVKEMYARVERAVREGKSGIIIEGMRLIDFNIEDTFDEIWFVDSSDEERVQRLTRTVTGMNDIEAELIIKAQQKNVEYARSVAHVVIKNTGNYETLAEQLEECVLRLYAHDIFPEYYERIGQINRSFIHSFINEHGLGGKPPEETAAILSQWYAGRYAGENPADNHV